MRHAFWKKKIDIAHKYRIDGNTVNLWLSWGQSWQHNSSWFSVKAVFFLRFVTDQAIVHSVSQMLKVESCHDAIIYVTGGTRSCHCDNLHCHQLASSQLSSFIEEDSVKSCLHIYKYIYIYKKNTGTITITVHGLNEDHISSFKPKCSTCSREVNTLISVILTEEAMFAAISSPIIALEVVITTSKLHFMPSSQLLVPTLHYSWIGLKTRFHRNI